MRVPVVAATAIAAALVPDMAVAASHTLTSKRVSGGSVSVSSCGTLSGVGVSWTSTGGTITKIVLTSIPSTCIGGTLSLTFANSSNTSIGTAGPSVVGATSMTLTTTGSPTANLISAIHIAVVGP